MIKICSDGTPARTHVSVVDEDGMETKLGVVSTVEFSLDADAADRRIVRLGFAPTIAMVVEICVPATGEVVESIRLIDVQAHDSLKTTGLETP
jgi:hypothetical protein